ncbi:MAG TPA: AI-2E family transporter [Armatimonadota bacterium]|nr:AI-2E family transporter [Armatimonadota bacterium]
MHIRVSDLVKLILLVFAIIIAMQFIGQVARVVLLFALVILLAMLLLPLVNWLARHRMPRGLGAPAVVLGILAVLAVIGVWIVPPLLEQATAFIAGIPEVLLQAQAWFGDLAERYPRVRQFVQVDEQVMRTIYTRAGVLLQQAGLFTIGVFAGLAALVLVLVMTVFTLIRPFDLLQGFFALIPAKSRDAVARALRATARQTRVWALSSMIVGLVNGAIAWVALSLLGVQPALLLATLVFFGEFLPYIGPIAAAIPAIIIAFTISPLTALWTVLLYLGIEQLEAGVLSPLVVAKRMKFHPLSIAFAIIALGEIYGILGAFLAIPALAAVKAFYTELVLTPRTADARELAEHADFVVEAQGGQAGKQEDRPV